MRPKTRPLSGPLAAQKQKTGTSATLSAYMHIEPREPTRHPPNSANPGPNIPSRKKIGATKRD